MKPTFAFLLAIFFAAAAQAQPTEFSYGEPVVEGNARLAQRVREQRTDIDTLTALVSPTNRNGERYQRTLREESK